MESIKELRTICQKSRESCDTWHGKKIARPISIYITVLFLKLGISANVATAIFLATGIIGSLLLGSTNILVFFAGVVMLQLWYLLDHVDGEIARYRKQTSLTGAYFDHISHYIVHPLIFFCLAYGLFLRSLSIFYIVFGFIAGLSTILLSAVVDVYLRMSKDSQKESADFIVSKEPKSLARRLFSLIHAICTFPIVIDILIFCALIDILLNINAVGIFLILYAVSVTFVWSVKLFYYIMTKRLDKVDNY